MLSDDGDDDYIPEGLADFLKQADDALNAETAMIDEICSDFPDSSTPNQSGESTDAELSHLSDLRSNMEKISLLDQRTRAYTCRDDDSMDHSDFAASPVPHNPAAHLTYSDAKRTVLGSDTPSSMIAPSKKSDEAEDSIEAATTKGNSTAQTHSDDLVNSSATLKASFKEAKDPSIDGGANINEHFEASGTSPDSLTGATSSPIGNLNEVVDDKDKEKEKAAPSPVGCHQDENSPQPEVSAVASLKGENNGSQSDETEASLLAPHQSTEPKAPSINSVKEAPHDGGKANQDAEEDNVLAGKQGSPPDKVEESVKEYGSGLSNLEIESNSSKDKKSNAPQAGTPKSSDSLGGNDKNQGQSQPKSEIKDTGVAGFPPETNTNGSQPASENSREPVQQESRSLFGAFKSFARSVVPTNKGTPPDTVEAAPSNTSKSDSPAPPINQQEAHEGSPSPFERAVPTSKVGQADGSRPTVSPSQSFSSTEEMMQNVAPANSGKARPDGENLELARPTRRAPSPTQSLSSTEEMMKAAPPPPSHEQPEKGNSGAPGSFAEKNDQNASTSAATSDEPMVIEAEKQSTNDQQMNQEHEAPTANAENAMLIDPQEMQVEATPQMEQPLKPQASRDSADSYMGGSITTAGSLAHRTETSKEAPRNYYTATKPSAEKTPLSLVSPKSRLFQPTASSRRHTQSAEKRSLLTPMSKAASRGYTPSTGKRSTPSRVPVPSAVRITSSVEKRPATASPVEVKSRFMQPTVAKRAHLADSVVSEQTSTTGKRTGGTTPFQVSSRLMRGTATSSARVTSSPPSASSTRVSPSVLPRKRDVPNDAPNDAVARARERVRLRKLQEAKSQETRFRGGSATFNMGTKPKSTAPRVSKKTSSPHFATPTSATRAHQQAPNVSMAQSAVFFGRVLRDEPQTSPARSSKAPRRKQGSTGTKFSSATSRLTQPTASARARAAVVPMAQSTTFFGKGLRGGNSSPPKARGKRTLTVPEEPKFTSRYGGSSNKRVNKGTTVSLAQSTNLLAATLRGGDSAPPVKRSTGLTRPQAPKFHTTHKRALPKSQAEIEAENMKSFRALPFKANLSALHTGTNQNSLHTGSSAGLTKVNKRRLTKPEPFKLSSSHYTPRTKPTVTDTSSSNTRSQTKMDRKRTATIPQPFKFGHSSSSSARNKVARSNPPKQFKARPLPKTTFKGPAIPVHTLTTPQKETSTKQEVSNGKSFSALPNKGPARPPPAAAQQSESPTTPEPFKLKSVKRHDAFQALLQEKVASEEEEFKKNLCPKALPLPESTYTPDIKPKPCQTVQ